MYNGLQTITPAISTKLHIKNGTADVVLDCSELLYVEAMQNYVRVFTETANHTILMPLKSLKEKLPEGKFFQSHRSYIVSLSKIEKVQGDTLVIDRYKIPVSKRIKSTFMRTYKEYIS